MKRKAIGKKFFALLLAVSMIMSSLSLLPVYAAEENTVTYTQVTDLSEIYLNDARVTC